MSLIAWKTIQEQKEDRTHIATEWRPHCENEIEMRWDTDALGFQAFCPVCGARLMLCDECRHAPDGWKCDFSAEQNGCRRSKKHDDE